MKILIVVENLYRGGRERRIIELIKGLSKNTEISFEVAIFRDIVEYQEIYDMKIPLHLVLRRSKNDLSVFPRFYKLLKEIKPDIVHSWGGLSSLISLPCAKLSGIKTFNSMITNSTARPFSQNWIRSKLTFPLSDVISSNSKSGIKVYKAPRRKTVLIYNGFSHERLKSLKPVKETKALLGVNTPKMVGMVGMFQPQKDYKTYITAATNILDKRNDVTFLAIGDGPYLETTRASVPKKYRQSIIFTGNRDDIESLDYALDIGVLTTNHKTNAEGISNALLEYMAVGKPVIATNDGGTPEIVTNDVNGYLIPGGNPEKLTEKLNYLLDNPDLAFKMGQRGKEMVLNQLTIEKMVESFLSAYKNLLDKGK